MLQEHIVAFGILVATVQSHVVTFAKARTAAASTSGNNNQQLISNDSSSSSSENSSISSSTESRNVVISYSAPHQKGPARSRTVEETPHCLVSSSILDVLFPA